MRVTNARWMVNITHEIQYLVFSSVAHKYIWSTLSFMIMVIMIIISTKSKKPEKEFEI